MKRNFLFSILLLSASLILNSYERIKIVTSTSDIECIVKEVGRGRVETMNIVPPSLCPGHFEIKIKDLIEIQKGRAILYHGWERWMEKIKNGPVKIAVNIEGNWMIPEINQKASEKILNILLKIDPEGEKVFIQNFSVYKERLNKLIEDVNRLKSKFKGLKGISSLRQKDFLEYLGMDVIAVFDDSEMSVKEIREIVFKGRGNVRLVVDNLQRESDSGKRIAEEIGVKYIVLTNFPVKGSYEDSLRENILKIEKSLK